MLLVLIRIRAVRWSDYSPTTVPSEEKDTTVLKNFWCLNTGEKDGMNLLQTLKTYQGAQLHELWALGHYSVNTPSLP